MKAFASARPISGASGTAVRGSALITALIFVLIIEILLIGYLKISTNSLSLSHRTYFADLAGNLAEAGTEEAIWSFNKLGYASDAATIATAWSGWTLGTTVADVGMTSMGSGYTSAPTVSFSGGGGTGAAGTAIISTVDIGPTGHPNLITRVAGVTITNQGSGYTSNPTITLSGGGGSGATAEAHMAATRTINFPNLDQQATGTVKVWVAGYQGTSVLPIVVTKATITPQQGPPITKIIKIIMTKSSAGAKGVLAYNTINWNGHPNADSFISSNTPGVPPFTQYDPANARSNTILGSLYGPTVDLGSGGVVSGNVMLGPGVTVTNGTITGTTSNNLSINYTPPTYPVNSGDTAGVSLGSSIPSTLPRGGDLPSPADGKYYYYINGANIGSTTITAGKKVVIVDTGVSSMDAGLQIGVSGAAVGNATLYLHGPVSPGNGAINSNSWAGALTVYTDTHQDCTISGNGFFCGQLYAPYATLVGNGGGNNPEDLVGSFVVGSITSNGHMSFHYDEGLGGSPPPKAWSLGLWVELQSAANRALYANQLNF
jgi:hypothetical protein